MISEGLKSGKEVELKKKKTRVTQLQISDENTKHWKFGPGESALHSQSTQLPPHRKPVCFSKEASSVRNCRIKTVLPAGGSLQASNNNCHKESTGIAAAAQTHLNDDDISRNIATTRFGISAENIKQHIFYIYYIKFPVLMFSTNNASPLILVCSTV